jgi:hypothetical protein
LGTSNQYFKTDSRILRRHYTTTNALRKPVYEALMECLRTKKNVFPMELLMEGTNTVAVTIKNYNLEKGLSKRFFSSRPETFEIAGQFGKGLMIDNNSQGVYFAFAAGTGVLVFIDLVARILLQSVGVFQGK